MASHRFVSIALICLTGLALTALAPAHANLLTNGGFEGSSSTVTTPPSWFNIGHTKAC